MFCTSCGVINPEEAQFCYRCGKPMYRESQLDSTPLTGNPTKMEIQRPNSNVGAGQAIPSAQSGVHQSVPKVAAVSRKDIREHYIWHTVNLVFLTPFIALMAFTLTAQFITGAPPEKAEKTAVAALALTILLVYGARRSWKWLLEEEPDSNPLFKRKHRRFQVIGGMSVAVLLALAVGLGVGAGNRAQRNIRRESLQNQMAQLPPKNAEFRQRLGVILSEEPTTMEDYYNHCLKVEALLNEFEPHFQRQLALAAAFYAEYEKELKSLPNKVFLNEITRKDSEFIAASRREVAKAKELHKLPYNRQTTFYEREIVPIQTEIERISAEQMTLVQQAQARGIRLPADISEWLK